MGATGGRLPFVVEMLFDMCLEPFTRDSGAVAQDWLGSTAFGMGICAVIAFYSTMGWHVDSGDFPASRG